MGGRPRLGCVRSGELRGMAGGDCKRGCELEQREDDVIMLK